MEQDYIERAHLALGASRERALSLQDMVEVGEGGTHQARYEREIIWDSISTRLNTLDIGNSSLVFGRLDRAQDQDFGPLYVGRVAVWGDDQEPITIDWRAPAAEAFYRATGHDPMGLTRRRHFATRGWELLGVEDEYFDDRNGQDAIPLVGEATLRAGLEAGRTGRLADAAATIQAEQDAIVRSPMDGALIVQGGPGTGKTVAALHRAAYLLYTHRFPLHDQGVLVLGPNRLFLTYIEQVLPSLGEAGVEVSMLADLISGVRVKGIDVPEVARIKGDPRMVALLTRARRDRQRRLREDLVVGYGLRRLRLTVDQSAEIVAQARRRFRTHNRGRRFVENQVYWHLATSGTGTDDPEAAVVDIREQLHGTLEMRQALEWMWPVLTPAHFLHDLFGSSALLRSAARTTFATEEVNLLYRRRSAHSSEVVWTSDDAPLLDEAMMLLGPRSAHAKSDTVRTYGHIVVDEAQDLSPMQLRMIQRRSLNGSMTVVGDIVQATTAWGHDSWDSVIEQLSGDAGARYAELTIGYRLPEPTMAVAARVLAAAVPHLSPPRPVRTEGQPPRFVSAPVDVGDGPPHASLVAAVSREVATELSILNRGNLAVICHGSMTDAISAKLTEDGVDHGLVYEGGLESRVTIAPVEMIKGLEVDIALVVEPADICERYPKGMRALYVALTRATQNLVVIYSRPLPDPLLPFAG